MADQTAVLLGRTLAPMFTAAPPTSGPASGNGNDVNVPATAAPRARIGAVVSRLANRGDDGSVTVSVSLTTRTVVAFGCGNAGSIPNVAALTTRVFGVIANAPTFSLGVTHTPRVALVVVVVPGAEGSAGATSTIPAYANGVAFAVLPSFSIEVLRDVPLNMALGYGVVPSFAFTQSPSANASVSVAIGMATIPDTGGTGSSLPSGAPASHDLIRANPRGGPAKARREV